MTWYGASRERVQANEGRRTVLNSVPRQLFLNGTWTDGEREPFGVTNPATEETLTRIANASPEQGTLALNAAVEAQESWARTPSRHRAELLRAAFEQVTARRDEFATLMTLEMGKPLAESYGEVTYGTEFLRWFSEEAPRVRGTYQAAPEGNSRQLVLRRPVGPCLLVTPWNFPLAMATRKIAPALAAGCTVVVRPASLTPLTTLLFAQVLADVGVPAGVVNVLTSTDHDVTDRVLADPRLRKLSFTGSTQVGRALLKQASDHVLRTSMELGGNAPFIVCDDADLDLAVRGAMQAKLRNMGEACTAANRFLVHESVADEFAARLAAQFEKLTVGDGLAEGTDVGPLVSQQARDHVHSLVTDAVGLGAEIRTGGAIPDGSGFFYPPTVVTRVPSDSSLASEEIFGPVAAITTFSDEADAIARANHAEVGLSGYLFTRDMSRILRIAETLEVGMIGVNQGLVSNAAAPFGGVKQSGLGREGGSQGIDEYLETIYLALPDPWA